MRKIAGLIFASLMSMSSLPAACGGACGGSDWPSPVNVDVALGYRQDKLHYSIAGPNDYPNTISKLEWKDIQMVEVAAEGRYVSCRNYVVKLDADYAYICSGRVIDSDYFGNDETYLFSRSVSNSGKGYAYDLSGAVGYQVISTCGRFIGTPLIGYNMDSQHFKIFDGEQVDIYGYPVEIPIEGLNSHYTTRWFGPWIGLDFTARVETCAYVFGGFEWHLASFRGTLVENLRLPERGAVHQKAHGTGYVITLGGKWEISCNWAIGIVSNYRRYQTRQGKNVSEISFNNGYTIDRFDVNNRLNQVKWQSIDVLAMVNWRF